MYILCAQAMHGIIIMVGHVTLDRLTADAASASLMSSMNLVF